MERILVTGGAGFIGSHTVVELLEHRYHVTVLDDFSNSTPQVISRIRALTGKPLDVVQGSIERDDLQSLLSGRKFDGMIHFAALKSVAESVENPLRYYEVNVEGTRRLMAWAAKNAVDRVVFSSSATVYGIPETCPVDESAALAPINPYGRTKLACEMLIRDVCESNPSMHFALLRYFNPAGAHESGMLGESPTGTPANLFPYILGVLNGEFPALRIFGNDYGTPDGTGIRDFIHVMDLAEVHRCALVALGSHPSICVNVGTGRGYSVSEVVAAFEALLGHSIPTQLYPRRPGDAPACYARTDLSGSVLDWHAKRGLEEMCRDALRWAGQAESANRR